MKNKLWILIGAILLIIGAVEAADVSFEDTGTTDVPTAASGVITGKISVIGKNYIVVVYKSDKEKEYEVLLPIDAEKIKVEHKKDLKAFNIDDTVSIQYEDTEEDTLEGPRKKRNAKVIKFVKAAPPKPPEPVEEEE